MNNNKSPLNRGAVLIACMLAMFMSAIEITIVATAMPTIIAELGGFSSMSWIFSAYLLTQAISVPIYGRLADLFGRKKLLIIGIILFLVGSLLCGFAKSITWLILFRAIQGLGAGGIVPIASTVVGDIYAPAERAKIQGYLASVWAISAIIGPLMGAFIVDNLSWSIVFWVNIPLGILALLTFLRFLPEVQTIEHPNLDIKGIVYLAVCVSSLLFTALQFAQLGLLTIPLLCVAFTCAILLVRQEKTCPYALFPQELWQHKVIIAANFGGLLVGAALMGLTVFLPTFIQGVMGLSPFEAGATLAFISLGWPLASTLSGHLMLKTSYRFTAVFGTILLIIGCLFLIDLNPHSSLIHCRVAAFVIGCGMGLSTTTFLIAVQASVSYENRGIATASIVFTRLIGSALGAALLGGGLNLALNYYLPDIVDPIPLLMQNRHQLVLEGAVFNHLIENVNNSIGIVFLLATLIAALTFISCWMIPAKLKPQNKVSETD